MWIGATVVNQEEADRDIPKLLAVPARVRFLSVEPMLGPIELDRWLCIHKHWKHEDGMPAAPWHPPYPKHWYKTQAVKAAGWEPLLHWVIAGGESGPKARPMHPDWARSLRDQCAAAGVAWLWKQNGEWLHEDQCGADGRTADFLGTEKSPLYQWPGDLGWSVRIGKAAAGRLLDGVEHNGFPT